jgi:predicted amidohydrolase YtcJ
VPALQLTLLSKPGCHLCDDAREVVTEVVAAYPPRDGSPVVEFDEKSILDDPALFDEYVEEIPVVLIDGRVHTIWRVDPVRLRTALNSHLEESA